MVQKRNFIIALVVGVLGIGFISYLASSEPLRGVSSEAGGGMASTVAAEGIYSVEELYGLARLLSSYGREGDTELVHVNKEELELLERIGRGTTNPYTGLREFPPDSAVADRATADGVDPT